MLFALGGDRMAAFWSEVLIEGIKFVFLVCVAVGGIFAGIALRKHKDKKDEK